jgi:hypothetical protein
MEIPMTSAILSPGSMKPAAVSAARHRRSAAALLSLMNVYELMNIYEQGDAAEQPGESETELMVLLSGMVAVDTRALASE